MTPVTLVALPIAAALWAAGLRVFLHSGLTVQRRLSWSGFLLLVGIAVAFVLPLPQIWNKFLIVLAIIPLAAAADLWLFRSGRSFSFWLRACGFEAGTVFFAAMGTRLLLDAAGIAALVRTGLDAK